MAIELLKALLTSYNSAIKHPDVWKTVNNMNSVCNSTTMVHLTVLNV